jgi:hypothetical protein
MKLISATATVALLILGGAAWQAAHAQAPEATGVIFENVRVFDGTSDRLSPPSNVLVVGNLIRRFPATPIADTRDIGNAAGAAGARSCPA